jgi:hypothetical protein
MPIDFDSLTGIADEEFRDPSAPVVAGLVVARKANNGNDLVLEAAACVDSTRGLPLVMFIETDDDDPNVEVFANAEQYRVAMDRFTPPTMEEAMAWEAQVISERLEKWRGRLDEVGLWPL